MADTDYLVIGAGALGMAFTDQLLDETDCTITLVDRRARPGGHWNDAYPFVRLHQPSAFYGVGSRVLGSNRIEQSGLNRGMLEQATGAEVSDYYQHLLQDRFLPSGRVQYLPMTEHRQDGELVSLETGETTRLNVAKRIVDGSFTQTSIPANTAPRFSFVHGTSLATPNDLPERVGEHRWFTIIGGGKTGMDVAVWLLLQGIDAARIRWVMPRDSWLINRETVQPGGSAYLRFMDARAQQLECCVQASSVAHLFELLEERGLLLRLDPGVTPRMYHSATIAPAELELLRSIRDVIRQGRVMSIDADRMLLEHGKVRTRDQELFINCSASAVARRPVRPVFENRRITLQMIRAGQFCLSAALIAHVEASCHNDVLRNELCDPMPMPDRAGDWLRMTFQDNAIQARWLQDMDLRRWVSSHRLTGADLRGEYTAGERADLESARARIQLAAGPAQANLARLLATLD